MRRSALFPAVWLAACGTAASPADLQAPSDQAGPAPADQSLLADLTAALRDMATPPSVDLAARPDLAAPPDLSSRGDLAMGYPPAPYGNNVGDVIAPLVWEGYDNPTAIGLANLKPYGALAMNDLRTSGNKFALLYAADDF